MSELEKATFAAGCFWGVEESFSKISGVKSTVVGYTGGELREPTYEKVCGDETGHAEAIEVEFDPSEVTYNQLLDVFWGIHDPTTEDRQGPDVGTQYRSAIFYHSEEQKMVAQKSIDKMNKEKFGGKIVTQLVPVSDFWKAEEYHQKYFEKKKGRRFGLF